MFYWQSETSSLYIAIVSLPVWPNDIIKSSSFPPKNIGPKVATTDFTKKWNFSKQPKRSANIWATLKENLSQRTLKKSPSSGHTALFVFLTCLSFSLSLSFYFFSFLNVSIFFPSCLSLFPLDFTSNSNSKSTSQNKTKQLGRFKPDASKWFPGAPLAKFSFKKYLLKNRIFFSVPFDHFYLQKISAVAKDQSFLWSYDYFF